MELVCLRSVGKDFHIVGVVEENERSPNLFFCSLGIYGILLSEEEHKFLLGVETDGRSDK